jgi:hypothetical protein
MPGQAACFRCGSLLEAKPGALEVHPPRAPAWKKPFRRAARRMRRYRAFREAESLAQGAAARTAASPFGRLGLPGLSRSEDALSWSELRPALRDAAVALALSIVPGLAQALRRQFGPIRRYVISWFLSLVMGILFFGQTLGAASMACAYVLHAWIATDAVIATKRFKPKNITAFEKISLRLCGIAFLVLLLYGAANQVQRIVGFTTGLAGVTVPADRVTMGDVILCHSLAAGQEPLPLKRGDLVLVRVRNVLYAHGGNVLHGHIEGVAPGRYLAETVGQLIALPGDQLALAPSGFTVNGRALNAAKFPVPASLNGQYASLTLGKDEYFVTMEWRAQEEGHGFADLGNVVTVKATAYDCVYPAQDVLARGVMRWSPIRNRGFLKELE